MEEHTLVKDDMLENHLKVLNLKGERNFVYDDVCRNKVYPTHVVVVLVVVVVMMMMMKVEECYALLLFFLKIIFQT